MIDNDTSRATGSAPGGTSEPNATPESGKTREAPAADADTDSIAQATGGAPDPGDPGGMGGVRTNRAPRHDFPPGGVSPIENEDREKQES